METTSSPSAAITKTGIPVRNLWHMFLYDWSAWQMKDRWRSEIEAAPNLDALLALILAELIQQRMRIGLARDYKRHGSLIAGIRGRVDFTESVARMAFQNGRAYCEFENYSANIAKNQIVRSVLAKLAGIGHFGPNAKYANDLRTRLRQIVLKMDSVSIIELSPDLIRREQLGRNDADYELMLSICNLLVQRLMPTETSGNSKLPFLDRDEYTLHQVYERFVAKFYRAHLTGWRISAQPKLTWPAQGEIKYLPALAPDLILTHEATGTIIVLDTKFTQHVLVAGAWDNTVFDRSHLFQIYAYVKSQEDRSEGHRAATGILLYPTVNHRLSHQVSIHNHVFRWETIDLAQRWEDVERDLLHIPAAVKDA